MQLFYLLATSVRSCVVGITAVRPARAWLLTGTAVVAGSFDRHCRVLRRVIVYQRQYVSIQRQRAASPRVYKTRPRVYRVLFYCTILVDAAVRLLIVRVLYVVIYRHSRLYVSVFIVSFILYI